MNFPGQKDPPKQISRHSHILSVLTSPAGHKLLMTQFLCQSLGVARRPARCTTRHRYNDIHRCGSPSYTHTHLYRHRARPPPLLREPMHLLLSRWCGHKPEQIHACPTPEFMIFGKSGLQGLPMRVALRDIRLRLSQRGYCSPRLTRILSTRRGSPASTRPTRMRRGFQGSRAAWFSV